MEEAIRRIMGPIWEPTFSPDRYGFHPRRTVHEAGTRIYGHLAQGYHRVADADIQDYFGWIDQSLLMVKGAERIADGTVLGPIRDMLRAGVSEAGKTHPTHSGPTQGGLCEASDYVRK